MKKEVKMSETSSANQYKLYLGVGSLEDFQISFALTFPNIL
jgi:hypothetical protein